MIILKYITKKSLYGLGIMFFLISMTLASCDFAFELPEEGSLADETPPSAAFGYAQNAADYLQVDFSNLSVSATDYSWDFGDGNTSSDANPSNTYTEEGTYTVSLTASDKLNVSSSTTQEVVVEKPVSSFQPVILEPGFEENSLPDGTGNGKDTWRNGDLGGVIQITSSPVFAGEKAAKFPSGGDRIGYQLITVESETDYSVDFYYTMKTSPVGTLTVSILGGAVSNPDDIAAATIASVDLNDQDDASTYVPGKVVFNSGDNTEIAIYISNVDVECRADEFTISKIE